MRAWMGMAMVGLLALRAEAQLLATDDFEGYTTSPVGALGGSGDWISLWGVNSQNGGGVYLNTSAAIDGAKSAGLFGLASEAGQSISRAFPACTNVLAIGFSMRGDFNVNNSGGAPTNLRRMAFTIRSGNDASHFGNQRLSFYFAAGTTNFQWYDGTDRITNALNFTLNHAYDVRVTLNPTNRAYSFVASNRTTGAAFSYSGAWTVGAAGDPIGSVAFLMRGPTGAGNDAFLDSVSVSAPAYTAPPLPALPIAEGDAWRYYKGTSTPPLQGTNQWYRPEYLDGAWGGPSPSGFGYGDCDDGTALDDMLDSYISVFTRKAFRVDSPAAVSNLTLAADFDDGLIAYLNGVEVARLNMPGGTITRHTAASVSREGSRGEGASIPNEPVFVSINPALLVAGTNVLAVAGHNIATNSSDFSLIVELHTNTTLLRGPFLQMPDEGDTAAIVWKTAALADSVVDYGLDLSYSAGTVSNGALVRDHTVKLSGLLPGTTYYYRVRGGGEVLRAGLSFRTRPSAAQAFRFVVIGDHGQGTEWMSNIAARVNARSDYDAILTVGDNIYGNIPCSLDGAPGWYDPYWFRLYGPAMARVATFPALGNHDWDTASGQYMVDYFRLPTNGPANHIGKNYSFEFGNMHVVVIDTEPYEDNNGATMAEINAWLAADLASATQRWRVALLHRPPYTTQGSHNDNTRVKANIVPLLKAGGVQVVFQGHNHWYERINPIDGTHYITTAGAGAWLYVAGARKEYSAVLYDARHSYTVVDVQGGRMALQQFNDLDQLVDEFQIDLDHAFAIDGLLDSPAWLRASNGLNLHAAIRGPHLYVATQDAGEGSDHFVYVASQVSTQRPANWSKSGAIMQWGAFLADENDGAFNGWFDAAGAAVTDPAIARSMSSGLNNNGTNGNGVIEGTLNLTAHFGAFPQQLYLAAAPFLTTNGGHLLSGFQVPAGNGNGDIESSEFLLLNARDIALDLPVAAAATNAPREAGMPVLLDGTPSFAPSGLPLTQSWAQVSGPPAQIASSNAPQTQLTVLANVTGVETVRVQLAVNDTRFTETTVVEAVFFAWADADGDGLSDSEESTGVDNVLTPLNPNGYLTNPGLADTDGDGMTDGQESVAGTNPGDPLSRFELVEAVAPAPAGLVLRWSSATDRVYQVWSATNLLSAWLLEATNVAATPPVNVYTLTPPSSVSDFYAVEVDVP
jgi:hypothetical protein